MTYIVELDKNECWLSTGRGDPARTLNIKYAKRYKLKSSAQSALTRAMNLYGHFRNFDNAVIKHEDDWCDDCKSYTHRPENPCGNK